MQHVIEMFSFWVLAPRAANSHIQEKQTPPSNFFTTRSTDVCLQIDIFEVLLENFLLLMPDTGIHMEPNKALQIDLWLVQALLTPCLNGQNSPIWQSMLLVPQFRQWRSRMSSFHSVFSDPYRIDEKFPRDWKGALVYNHYISHCCAKRWAALRVSGM